MYVCIHHRKPMEAFQNTYLVQLNITEYVVYVVSSAFLLCRYTHCSISSSPLLLWCTVLKRCVSIIKLRDLCLWFTAVGISNL